MQGGHHSCAHHTSPDLLLRLLYRFVNRRVLLRNCRQDPLIVGIFVRTWHRITVPATELDRHIAGTAFVDLQVQRSVVLYGLAGRRGGPLRLDESTSLVSIKLGGYLDWLRFLWASCFGKQNRHKALVPDLGDDRDTRRLL